MASDKQIKANQQNSLKGGVKTPDGKAISKYNALKHGLLSEEVLLHDEHEDELQELGKRLRADLKPLTELEMILVERIIANTWRLKRALRLETEMMEGDERWIDLAKTFNLAAYNGDTFGKFARYETAIEKGIYKALHELQRLQIARNGGNVLAPIAIDVNMSEE